MLGLSSALVPGKLPWQITLAKFFAYCQFRAIWLRFKFKALAPFFCDVARQNVELVKQNTGFYFGFSAFKFFCGGSGHGSRVGVKG